MKAICVSPVHSYEHIAKRNQLNTSSEQWKTECEDLTDCIYEVKVDAATQEME